MTSEARSNQHIPATRIIQKVPAERLLDALERVVMMGRSQNRTTAQRFVTYAASQNLPLDQVWALVGAEDRYQQALLAIPNRGRTAMLFASIPKNEAQADDLSALLTGAEAQFDGARIRLAQALLDPHDRLSAGAYLAAGYLHLAELSYLDRSVPRLRAPESPEPWPDGCTIEPYSTEVESDFKEALNLSYEDTLDCPRLCGLRTIEDVWRDHKGAGIQDPELWTLIRRRSEPVAVLLLSPLADQSTVELSYIGVAKCMRGVGLGRKLVLHGLHQLFERRYDRVTLAVDEANTPAGKMYKSLGFIRAERRSAYVRKIEPPGFPKPEERAPASGTS